MTLNGLSRFTVEDIEKQILIEELIKEEMKLQALNEQIFEKKYAVKEDYAELNECAPELNEYADEDDYAELNYDYKEPVFYSKGEPAKFCPECGRKYSAEENFCLECAVKLKKIEDLNISSLELNPHFEYKAKNSFQGFEDILTAENLARITVEDFDVKGIVRNIKITAFERLDNAIKENNINLDDLSILERILLFSKSFVDVEYKSYGPELGFYRFNRIFIDDRQTDALQITTLLHELTHFLLKEILTHVLCSIWDCTKTTEIESIATFILSYSPITSLVDEYAAHTVEGRFTLYGFQDYSSYSNIEKSIELDETEIEMLKTIGNTFANIIKGILESFIDGEMLREIKTQFRKDILDQPDYRNLLQENCTLLNDDGLDEAIRFLLADGFAVSMDNVEKLQSYNEMW